MRFFCKNISLFANLAKGNLKFRTMSSEKSSEKISSCACYCQNHISTQQSISEKVKDMRKPYLSEPFLEKDLVAREPFAQFTHWFDKACATPGIEEANAMCLATASKTGKPACRMVLLKGFSKEGFSFFTHYSSRKGRDLEENPYAALNFYWEPLKKCVRIEGRVEKLSEKESSDYFHSRPVGSQIGSALSPQSTVIKNRDVLIDMEKEMLEKYDESHPVPKPSSWGGYRVVAESVEFWQGHVNRMHDRIRFRKSDNLEGEDGELIHKGDDGWVFERLAP